MTNINDLTEQQLSVLAALGQGWQALWIEGKEPKLRVAIKGDMIEGIGTSNYDPCNNWSQAGELVEKYKMEVFPSREENAPPWCAFTTEDYAEEFEDEPPPYADTPKLAITKAFVASIYGTEIDFDAIVGGEA